MSKNNLLMHKNKWKYIILYSLLDLILSWGFGFLHYYNTDVYFLPFVLFIFFKVIIFEILLTGKRFSELIRSRGVYFWGGFLILLFIGFLKFYNLFAIVSFFVFILFYYLIFLINLVKKNYKKEDVALLLVLLPVNICYNGWTLLAALFINMREHIEWIFYYPI
jgi:hypothetical protein